MLLVRIAFWIAVVAFLLPSAPGTSQAGGAAQASGLDAQEAVALAVAAGSDVAGFCERNPQTCEIARDAGLHIVSQVVFYGSAVLDWASDAAHTAGEAAKGTDFGA